ncbi:MAG: ABC-F family ATP-binding cassette domain-containing protein [Clostridia bacterium]|nr:ABC-F family ATP-binding cassette domain-containing protein [Clostridia bacterium]
MQLIIKNGSLDLSGEQILRNINFEITDNSRIALVGRNGCGKTSLLKIISGEYSLTNGNLTLSGKPKIGTLSQMTFKDENLTLVEEIRSAYEDILSLKKRLNTAQENMSVIGDDNSIRIYTELLDTFTNMGGFYFEKEYEAAIKKFGFTFEEKFKKLSEFSGGQRTKIAFLKLLLSKPDILLLDEPTNHLDIEAISWLEEYLKNYKKAFVVVSHDRMFLDNVANITYEIEYGKTEKYFGNYTFFTAQKKIRREQQQKEYNAQQKEIAELEGLIDRFRYKATKADMAQSKIKQLEKIERMEAPDREDKRTFHTSFTPEDLGVKDVLSVENLEIGYDLPLSTVSLEVKRGDRIGIIGGNGLGKSTFIKTIVGKLSPLSGSYRFGGRIKIGYFDQQMAEYESADTVLDDFYKAYPNLTDFEARSTLGAFMFSGEDVFKTVSMLSGGERVRLALCKLFLQRPNLLILDEPTNHLDIVGKETLEDILENFEGTIIFVSHDRYFIKKIADKILSFEKDNVSLFDFGYEQYLESQQNKPIEENVKETEPKPKRKFTTPLKERSKKERAVKKAEEKIALLEEQIEQKNNELEAEENQSDYEKLTELQNELDNLNSELEAVMEDWETLTEELISLTENT